MENTGVFRKISSTQTLLELAAERRENRDPLQNIGDYLHDSREPGNENLQAVAKYLREAKELAVRGDMKKATRMERLAYEAVREFHGDYGEYQRQSLDHGTEVAEKLEKWGSFLFLVGVTGGLGAWAHAGMAGSGMALGFGPALLRFGSELLFVGSGYALANAGKREVYSFLGGEESPNSDELMEKDFRVATYFASLQYFVPFALLSGQAWAQGFKGWVKDLIQLSPLSILQAGHGAAQVVSEGGSAATAAQAAAFGAVLPFAFYGMTREISLAPKQIPKIPAAKKLPFEYIDRSGAEVVKTNPIPVEEIPLLPVRGGASGAAGFQASGSTLSTEVIPETIFIPVPKTSVVSSDKPIGFNPNAVLTAAKTKIQAPSGVPALENRLPGESRPPIQVPAIPGAVSMELAGKKQEPIGDPMAGLQFMGDPEEFQKEENPLRDLSEEDLEKLKRGETITKSNIIFTPQKDDSGQVTNVRINREREIPPSGNHALPRRTKDQEEARKRALEIIEKLGSPDPLWIISGLEVFFHELEKRHGELLSSMKQVLEETKSQGWNSRLRAKSLASFGVKAGWNFNAFRNLHTILEGMDSAGMTSEQQAYLILLLSKKSRPRLFAKIQEEDSKESPEKVDPTMRFPPRQEEVDELFGEVMESTTGRKPDLDQLEGIPARKEQDPADILHHHEQEKAMEAILDQWNIRAKPNSALAPLFPPSSIDFAKQTQLILEAIKSTEVGDPVAFRPMQGGGSGSEDLKRINELYLKAYVGDEGAFHQLVKEAKTNSQAVDYLHKLAMNDHPRAVPGLVLVYRNNPDAAFALVDLARKNKPDGWAALKFIQVEPFVKKTREEWKSYLKSLAKESSPLSPAMLEDTGRFSLVEELQWSEISGLDALKMAAQAGNPRAYDALAEEALTNFHALSVLTNLVGMKDFRALDQLGWLAERNREALDALLNMADKIPEAVDTIKHLGLRRLMDAAKTDLEALVLVIRLTFYRPHLRSKLSLFSTTRLAQAARKEAGALKILRDEFARGRHWLGKVLEKVDSVIPDEFYEIFSADPRHVSEGILIPIRNEEDLSSDGAVWSIKSIEGDLVTFQQGQKERVFQVAKGKSGTIQFQVGDKVRLRFNIKGGSGNDDKTPTQPYQQISPEKRQKLLELFQNHPQLKAQMDESGWTLKEKSDFLSWIFTKTTAPDKVLSQLPQALGVLQEHGWTYQWQYLYLPHLAEMAKQNVDWALKALSKAVGALHHMGLNPEQEFRLLYLVADKTGMLVPDAYEKLVRASRALEITQWRPEKKDKFLSFLSQRAGSAVGSSLEGLKNTLTELKEFGWGFHENLPFLSFLIINAGHRPAFVRDSAIRRIIPIHSPQRPSLPPFDIQPWREFYAVHSIDGFLPDKGLIIPLRSAQNFPPKVEIWSVKYVEGDRLILEGGKETLPKNRFSPLVGQRIVKNMHGVSFPLQEGDKVVYWPAREEGSGPGGWLRKLFTPQLWKIPPWITQEQEDLAAQILSRSGLPSSRTPPSMGDGVWNLPPVKSQPRETPRRGVSTIGGDSGQGGGKSTLLVIVPRPGQKTIIVGREYFPELNSRLVSREHCLIEQREGKWFLTDHSRHGSYVDGKRVKEVEISSGAVVSTRDPRSGELVPIFSFRPPSPEAQIEEARVLNARILSGDREALYEGRVYYVNEAESIGGNAGRKNTMAINAQVDPATGQILAMGNLQNLPKEILEKTHLVTFLIKVPSFSQFQTGIDLKDSCYVEEVIYHKDLDLSVVDGLDKLVGIPFEHALFNPGEMLDGRLGPPVLSSPLDADFLSVLRGNFELARQGNLKAFFSLWDNISPHALHEAVYKLRQDQYLSPGEKENLANALAILRLCKDQTVAGKVARTLRKDFIQKNRDLRALDLVLSDHPQVMQLRRELKLEDQ